MDFYPYEPASEPELEDEVASNEEAVNAVPEEAKPKVRVGSHKPQPISAPRVRSVIRKYLDTSTTSEGVREALGVYLGVDTDPVEVTVALLTKPVTELTSALDKVESLRSLDDISAAVTLMGLGGPSIKALWSLTRALGGELPVRLPGNDMAVVTSLVKAIRELANFEATSTQLRDLVKRG